jgi:hypothetical protein
MVSIAAAAATPIAERLLSESTNWKSRPQAAPRNLEEQSFSAPISMPIRIAVTQPLLFGTST